MTGDATCAGTTEAGRHATVRCYHRSVRPSLAGLPGLAGLTDELQAGGLVDRRGVLLHPVAPVAAILPGSCEAFLDLLAPAGELLDERVPAIEQRLPDGPGRVRGERCLDLLEKRLPLSAALPR